MEEIGRLIPGITYLFSDLDPKAPRACSFPEDWELRKVGNLRQSWYWLYRSFGFQPFQHRDFIARLKLGAAEAVLPCLERQLPAIHFFESQLSEKAGNIGKGKNRVKILRPRFFFERLDESAPDSFRLDGRIDRQTPDFA